MPNAPMFFGDVLRGDGENKLKKKKKKRKR
jgi:hypothetical protein